MKDDYMPNDDFLIPFILEMLAYSGGAAVIAYLLFQYFGKTWIENKFAERLNLLRHQHALELQKLRVEIDSLLSGTIKLQEKEFTILPEAWNKLEEAHGLVSWLVAPFQQYADINSMNSIQLEEFLIGNVDFSLSQKDEIRNSIDQNKTYQDILFWYRLQKVKVSFSELQTFVARNGIFLPLELKLKFSQIIEILWSAIISKEIGHEVNDWKMQNEGWRKIKAETEPLYNSIESDIQSRLQSHGKSLSQLR